MDFLFLTDLFGWAILFLVIMDFLFLTDLFGWAILFLVIMGLLAIVAAFVGPPYDYKSEEKPTYYNQMLK